MCLQRLSRRESSTRNAQDFLNSHPSPIFCIGSEGEVTEWSEALVEITGLDRLSVLGKSAVGEVFGRNGLLPIATNSKRDEFTTEKLLALLASARQGYGNDSDGHEHSVIFSFHRKDNKRQVDVSFSCRPRLGSEGGAFGAFVFVKDLTTANALEKAVAVKLASEANVESKERHAAFLCHEIQQPVNGILATMEAMQEAMTSESDTLDCTEIVELLSLTTSCMDQLCLTIDCSLDTKEIEVNSLQAKPAPFQLTRTLRAVVSQIVKTAHEKGLSVECIIDDPELRVMKVLGDTLRIQQILANFCWNSVKFTSEGSITVSLECDPSRVTKPGFKHFIFKVADTGMGMDEELQERLFQKPGLIGARSSSSGKLGLDISRKLAELMGGQVRCTSVPGKGSTFSLELDLEIDTNSSPDPGTPFTSGEYILPTGKSDPDMNRLFSSEAAEPLFPQATRNSLDTRSIAAKPAAPSVMQQQPLPPPHAATAAAPAPATGFSGAPTQNVPLQYMMAPPLPSHAAAAAFSRSAPQFDLSQYTMANPWDSGSQHVYQPPYYCGGFMPQAPPNVMVPPFKVVRETVCGTSAAVLIEMHAPGRVWQQWGSATVVNGDTSSALRAAADDATRRIANCPQIQQPQVPMMPGYQYVPAVPMAAFPPQPPAAAGFHLAAQAMQTSQHQGAQIAPAAPGPAPPHGPVPPSASAAPPATPPDPKPTPPVAKLTPLKGILRSKSLSAAHRKSPRDRVHYVDPRAMLPSRIKVLVVDGDPEHLKEVQKGLECSSTYSKFEVTVAEDGQDVVRLGIAQGIRYDVILMGEKMKRMNGSEAASVYRKYEASNGLPKTLMILSSDNPSPLHVMFYQSCGIDGTVEKPTATKSLAKDIMTCFGWRLEKGPHKPLGPFLCRKGKLLAEATDAKSSVWIKDTESFESSLFFGGSNLEVFGRCKGGGLTGRV